jgi:hypothetical protein
VSQPDAEEKNSMFRSSLFTRSALGFALALGTLGGSVVLSAPALAKEKEAKPAPAPKPKPSKAFIAPYTAAQNAIVAAGKRPDVMAARTQVQTAEAAVRAARTKKTQAEARTGYDAAVAALGGLLTPEKGLVDAAYAVATVPDDTMLAGNLAFELGKVGYDKAMQRRGLQSMVESGKMAPAEAARYSYFVGSLAFELKDYPGARKALQAAVAGGYQDDNIEPLVAETYFNENQPAEGLRILEAAADRKGAAAPEDWLKQGVVVSYRAKQPEFAASFGSKLAGGYPTAENWALSLAVVRDLNRFQSQEQIDLLRLMLRTKSFTEARDYVEYIQAADPRRLPGEALKVIELGLASGKLSSSDVFVTDNKAIASGRIAADKASLVGLERDARAANATATTAMAAGDAFLSYDDAAKAEAMYLLAMARAGVDAPRVLTRLGIAQTDLGKYADAAATFARVEGPRSQIAKLWLAYIKTKTTAAPAPAA